MSVLTTFAIWYTELLDAVREALNGPLQDGLKKEIREQAREKVYDAYSSKSYRRGQIGAAGNLAGEVNGMQLEIRNVTIQQGSPGSMSETDFVETGAPEFHQPFPRPFMEEALQEYAWNKAPDDLADALRSKGFTVS